MNLRSVLTGIFFGVMAAGVFIPPASAQQPSDAEEVYLSFRYRGSEEVVISALYHNDTFHLPVGELFDQLQIAYETDLSSLRITGTYLTGGESFELYFRDTDSPFGRVGDRRTSFEIDYFIVGELDFYITPEYFEELFDLNFEIDLNSLSLSLETDLTLPVEEQQERERRREQISERRADQDFYPLEYDRQRKLLGGGFLDYTLNSSFAQSGASRHNYDLELGAEILGGDVEGTFFGSFDPNEGFTGNSRNLRWRYVPREQDLVSSISIGQNNSNGLINSNYRGVRITNEPIQPRRSFQEYVVDGTAQPQSEVELYLNNSLIDYQETDESGYYRFEVPLNYGSSRLSTQIYGRDGSVQQREERVQIPFTFLRPGELQYNIHAGRNRSSLFSGNDEFWQAQTNSAIGITPWLTARAGLEYYEPDPSLQPVGFGSVSTRIGSSYLLNFDAAPRAYYRVNGSVIYPSSVSLSGSYTRYQTDRSIFNALGSQEEYTGSFYLPFELFGTAFNLRFNGTHEVRQASSGTRYRTDFTTRMGRLNLRIGYLDRQVGKLEAISTPSSLLTGTATYIFSRRPQIPGILRGTYLRTQLDYSPYFKEAEEVELQLARSIFGNGRLQLTGGRNLRNGYNFAQLNLTFDFNSVRTNTVARNIRNSSSVSTNVRGSVGYDQSTRDLHFTNRQSVGRGATSVRMFIDEDNSGEYDEGEEILPYNAVRLQRASRSDMDEEGVIRVTQLESYTRHNFEINEASIKDPTVIPRIEQFSFVSDPNQYKPLDIPFYITGIIEGYVYRQREADDSEVSGLSGTRLYLESKDGEISKELRTFSDGSFYSYEIPPGEYRLFIDPQQLDYLNSNADPDTLNLTVEAVPDGDYIDGLEFTVRTRGMDRQEEIVPVSDTIPSTEADQTPLPQAEVDKEGKEYNYRVQIGSFSRIKNAKRMQETAEKRFNLPFDVIFNRQRGLYAVRTVSTDARDESIGLLLEILKTEYKEAVLVRTGRDSASSEEEEPYLIQVGAFATPRLSYIHADVTEKRFGYPVKVQTDHATGIHRVFVDASGDLNTAKARLHEMRQHTLYSDAFIPFGYSRGRKEDHFYKESYDFSYAIHVTGLGESDKQHYIEQLDAEGMLNQEIKKDPSGELILFENLNNWQETRSIHKRLLEISREEQPFIILTK